MCSGRCRAKRWRETHAPQDPEIRAALEAIVQLVQHTLGRFEKRSSQCPPITFGRMTTALSLLVLLGLGVAGPATALQFDTFSLSANIEPRAAENFFQGHALVVVTAAPDFRLSAGFSTFNLLFSRSALDCLENVATPFSFPLQYGAPCRPGDGVFAVGHGNGTDVRGSLSFAGQGIDPCSVQGVPPPATLCAKFDANLFWGAVSLPPFTGTTEITVASPFSADVGAGIFERDSPGSSSSHFFDAVGFSGTGRGQFDLVWQADTQAWLPLRAEGYIAPTPEPATLLLLATTAAGLGLVHRYRRRSRAHAA